MIGSAADFITSKGGPAAVARDIGHTPGAISVWKNRNRLPRSAWPEIMTAYPDVDLEMLKAMEGRASAGQSKGQAA